MSILLLLCSSFVLSQNGTQKKIFRVFQIHEYPKAFFFVGINCSSLDTVYFISLKDTLDTKGNNFEQISINKVYSFEIKDMDVINDIPPANIAEGYRIMFSEDIYIQRNGRNGKTFYTTQYLATNVCGLFIKKK